RNGSGRPRQWNRLRCAKAPRDGGGWRVAVHPLADVTGPAKHVRISRGKEKRKAMTPPTKMLMIFVDESDQWDDLPLYEAILRRLVKFEIAGATVQIGVMGFGSHHRIHRKRLFGVSDDRPVTIMVVENEAKLRQAIPEIRPLVQEGLILLTDVEVIPL